jgi:cytoskeletal protein RodZ
MSEILVTIGNKIKNARQKAKITENKVASDLGLDKKHLHKIEDGTLDEEVHYRHILRFLKTYLEYFNLDVSENINLFLHFHDKNHSTKKEKHIPTGINKLFSKKYVKLSLSIFTILILIQLFTKEWENKSIDNLSIESKILLK